MTTLLSIKNHKTNQVIDLVQGGSSLPDWVLSQLGAQSVERAHEMLANEYSLHVMLLSVGELDTCGVYLPADRRSSAVLELFDVDAVEVLDAAGGECPVENLDLVDLPAYVDGEGTIHIYQSQAEYDADQNDGSSARYAVAGVEAESFCTAMGVDIQYYM